MGIGHVDGAQVTAIGTYGSDGRVIIITRQTSYLLTRTLKNTGTEYAGMRYEGQ